MKDNLKRTDFMYAVIEKDIDLIKKFLKESVNINEADSNGWTALHFAAQNGDGAVAKLLLNNGANVDCRDSYGNTPLWRATFSNLQSGGEIIKLLLKYGADKNIKNKSGVSAYDLAKSITNYDLMKYFK